MLDVLDGDDDSDIRVLPARTGHHVAAAGAAARATGGSYAATRPR